MKEIEVMRPSAKQLAKLRKGHPVRLAKGEGLILVVHPDRFDMMSKTFLRGKARTVSLTPEELMANQKVSPEAHQEQEEVEENKNPATFMANKIGKAAESKTSSNIVGAGLKEPKSRTPVSNAGGTRGGMPIRTLVGAKDVAKHLGKLGSDVGQNYSGRLDAALGSAAQNHMTSAMTGMSIETARMNHLVPADHKTMSGVGLFAGRGFHKEKSSVGVGGNLLARQQVLPPALQSQPYGSNFQFQFTLPPNFQKFSGGK
jgi:hypothetical protein